MTNTSQTLANLSSQQKLQLIEKLRQQKEKANSAPVTLVDFSNFDQQPAYQQMKRQLMQLEAIGLQNPYFKIHQGVARNITQIGEQELINYSTYNYLGDRKSVV